MGLYPALVFSYRAVVSGLRQADAKSKTFSLNLSDSCIEPFDIREGLPFPYFPTLAGKCAGGELSTMRMSRVGCNDVDAC